MNLWRTGSRIPIESSMRTGGRVPASQAFEESGPRLKGTAWPAYLCTEVEPLLRWEQQQGSTSGRGGGGQGRPMSDESRSRIQNHLFAWEHESPIFGWEMKMVKSTGSEGIEKLRQG